MNRWLTSVLLAAVVVGTPAAFAQRELAPDFEAKVIHVEDGDTVTVLDGGNRSLKVRLGSIDAPETAHGRCKPAQPWSAQSARVLGELVKGKTVRFTCYDVDRYDRQVCDLHVGNTTANRVLVAHGLAWANRSAGKRYLRDPGVADAERQAEAQKAGLWRDKEPVAPWEWRRTVWRNTC